MVVMIGREWLGKLQRRSGIEHVCCSVRVWRMDQTNDDPEQPFPFTCRSVIRTGHQANIFNNKMLPHSSRMCVLTPYLLTLNAEYRSESPALATIKSASVMSEKCILRKVSTDWT